MKLYMTNRKKRREIDYTCRYKQCAEFMNSNSSANEYLALIQDCVQYSTYTVFILLTNVDSALNETNNKRKMQTLKQLDSILMQCKLFC